MPRRPVGDPPLGEPEVGGGEHVQGAVEAEPQLDRGVEGLALAGAEHLDQRGAPALDDLHHPELHHRAHLAVGEGLHRERAEGQQDPVDELLGGVLRRSVLGQPPKEHRGCAVVVAVDEAGEDEGIRDFVDGDPARALARDLGDEAVLHHHVGVGPHLRRLLSRGGEHPAAVYGVCSGHQILSPAIRFNGPSMTKLIR